MFKRKPLRAIAAALAFLFALSGAVLVTPARAAAPLVFRLRTADGGEITSEMLRGDVVVLAFGASWLPLSKSQVQKVQELADAYGPRNVRVYWVSTDSVKPQSKNYASDEQLRSFASKNGLKIAVLRDPDGALFKQTGADQLPSIVILDREGEVSGAPIGGLDPDPQRKLTQALSPRLDKLLAGQ
ncbi:MAG TPA: TlpA disulfide reductase family protein [Pyrinomonadaceae bacterium]|nr:TlpA disulfide reductase family protein [Pyrinomonadaceae bacterium]